MSPVTNTPQRESTEASRSRTWIWVAGGIGAAAGVASLVYTRSRRSPWDRARRQILDAAEFAREEAKPWMGWAAGAAAASAALAYGLRPKPSTWEQARRRGGRIAVDAGRQLRPWAGLAASTALSLLSAAYSGKQRDKSRRALQAGADRTMEQLADAGLQLLNRVRRISGETAKLYPRVRKLIA